MVNILYLHGIFARINIKSLELVKRLVLGFLLLYCISSTVSGQIMDIELGMPESEILFYVNPREHNNGFELFKKSPHKYQFIKKANPGFDLEVSFQMKDQRVSVIEKIYRSDNLEGMEILTGYYDEAVRSWSMKSGFVKNESMRRKVYHSFKAYHPKVEVFFDTKDEALYTFMIYYSGDDLIFTFSERSLLN
jgi:hypothetical protein